VAEAGYRSAASACFHRVLSGFFHRAAMTNGFEAFDDPGAKPALFRFERVQQDLRPTSRVSRRRVVVSSGGNAQAS
jgi:hypothetical protein